MAEKAQPAFMAVRKAIDGSYVDGGPLSAGAGRRYRRWVCSNCEGEVEMPDNYCRWCGGGLETEPLALALRGEVIE
jgi:hypothetical protein